MRTYPGIRPGLFQDPDERQQIKILDDMLRQVSGALSKAVFPGQQPPANINPSSTSSTQTGTQQVPTPFQGDTLYGLQVGAWTKLAIGAVGKAYISNGGAPEWGTLGIAGGGTGGTTEATARAAILPSYGGNALKFLRVNAGATDAEWAAIVADTHNLLSTTHTDTSGAGAETRGDLIVRNNSNTWVRLATGAASTVLRGGTDPSYGTIDNTYIDSRTRHLFWPAAVWVEPTAALAYSSGTAPNAYASQLMANGADTYLLATTVLPADFTTGSASWKLHFTNASGTSAANTRWVLYYRVVATGASLTGSPDQTLGLTTTAPNTTHQLKIQEISTTVSGLAAGDHVRLTIARLSTDAADTNTDDMNFVGLALSYTADM